MSMFVVTGASSGIGEACTLRLAGAGHRVIAGVRRDEDGKRLAAQSDSIVPVVLDITNQTHIDALVDRLVAIGVAGLDGLVNNAGVARGGPLEFLPLDDWREQFEVNVLGQIAVTKALIAALRPNRGRVVFVGSIAGRVAMPLLGPYCASKHAVEAIAEALREELRPWGMAVSVIEPGAVRTPIWAKGRAVADELRARLPGEAEDLYGDAIERLRQAMDTQERTGVQPDIVAGVVEEALTTRWPRYRYLVGLDALATGSVKRLLPDRVMAFVARSLGP